jgi:DNA-binding PadR family transcriptional regulator
MYPWTHLPPPLSPREFYVLLALFKADLHAYGLKGQVEKDSLGSIKLSDGTLHPLLVRLHDQGLIDMVGQQPVGASGRTRMHYAISDSGTICLREELTRLQHVVKMSEAIRLLKIETPSDIARLLNNFSTDV